MYKVKLPKILFLVLDIAYHYHKKRFFNTNDLAQLANQFSKELVRQRKDKKDYKYLEDTNFGGLRGNFSTLLTFRGLVQKGNGIVGYYGIGRDDRIVNAIIKGDIVLKRDDFIAHTSNKRLRHLLETEVDLFTIRETQAHIKVRFEKEKNIPLERDASAFPKESVVVSKNGQYFIRALVNNFVDPKNSILEYNILNLWKGPKFKRKNIHLLLVLPSPRDAWGEIFAVKNEDLYSENPLFLRVDLEKKTCFDRNGNQYKLYSLEQALDEFSAQDENISRRLTYNWDDVKKKHCEEEAEQREIKEDEFSVFLGSFLNWEKVFYVDGKDVVDMKVSSSGGPDVRLIFSGGTIQSLELEHGWKGYIDHKHHESNAWSGSWLFAEEEWDFSKILKLFKDIKKQHHERVPDVFLCIEKGERKAYRMNWEREKVVAIPLKFTH